jgi:HSP20 family molecular chaperone IbpA
LTVCGERKAREGAPEALREERLFGSFERHVALGDWLDPASVCPHTKLFLVQGRLSISSK